MSATQNKIFYGLAELFWSGVTETRDDVTGITTSSYTTPKAWPGAVSISQAPQGGTTKFRADDSDYWSGANNGGYSGDLVTALIPDEVKEFLGWETRDSDGIAYETEDSGSVTKYIALMFRFKGDQKNIRRIMYRCSLTRPTITSETTPEGNTPNIKGETTTVTATPRPDPDHLVTAKADPLTDATKYNAWYSAVQIPNIGGSTPTYEYTAVEPVGSENPKEEGWYVLQGDVYVPTNDTTVDENKTYYERTEVTG